MPRDGGGNALHGGGVVGEERGLEEQVLRRVAGYSEFGECDEVGVGGPGFVNQLDDAGGVAGDVADGGVELAQGPAGGCAALGHYSVGGDEAHAYPLLSLRGATSA